MEQVTVEPSAIGIVTSFPDAYELKGVILVMRDVRKHGLRVICGSLGLRISATPCVIM